MLKFTYRPTFRMRIRIALIVLITVAISITGAGSYWIAADIVERNAVSSNQISIHKSKQMLDNNLRQITVSVMTLMISDAFKNLMKDVSMHDDSRYAAHLSSLQPLFAQIKLSEPMTQAILVSTPIGEFYNTGYVRNASVPFIGSDIHRRLKSEKGLLWTIGHQDPFFANHERVISLAMEPITDFLVKDVYILVNISEESMKESLNTNLTEDGEELLLLTADGQEVLRSDGGIWGALRNEDGFWSQLNGEEAHFQYTLDEDDYIVNTAKLENRFGWFVTSIQKKSELFKQMDRIQWIVIGVAAVCIFIASILSKMLMVFLMKPINKLTTLMHKVEANDLSVRFESEHADEFSRVGIRFNMMLEEINNLIATIKEAEREKRTAEVKALQAHISPHFLYNTLNTIYFKCELGHNEDVGEMVLALSRMFQLGLNDGNAITTLEKEISHVKQYMTIQQRCYVGKFEYEIEVADESLYRQPVLKVLLQPLVENSILHGFKNIRQGGLIRISISQSEQDMHLTVTDNGQGMDAQRVMDTVVRYPPGGRSSYALYNIHDRLRLYYGDQAEMTITSEPNVRTTVSLRIPLQGA
ncbi:sensor histidine kinase [Cohnella thermotolerans]|uniref:sensor histidine kinase n=1 Tax=Cohnella thermotolerans TaxID=329858 RepID=UPI000411F2DE|nr:sensor histidine kinase [Cohnella thermotolerans]